VEIASPEIARTPGLGAVALLFLFLAALAGCGQGAAGGSGGRDATAAENEVVLTPEAAAERRDRMRDVRPDSSPQARVVELRGAGSERGLGAVDPSEDAPSRGAPTDAEVRTELREARASLDRFRQYLNTTAFLRTGPHARVLPDGTAVAP
jgi:hypothetical protein